MSASMVLKSSGSPIVAPETPTKEPSTVTASLVSTSPSVSVPLTEEAASVPLTVSPEPSSDMEAAALSAPTTVMTGWSLAPLMLIVRASVPVPPSPSVTVTVKVSSVSVSAVPPLWFASAFTVAFALSRE